MSDIPIITTEIFVAYSQCPRKAFLLLFSEDRGKPHDYSFILEKRCQNNRVQYLDKFLQEHPETREYGPKTFKRDTFLIEAILSSAPFEAYCAVLTKTSSEVTSRQITYEPTIITGTYSITSEQKTELLFVGSVLGKIQKQEPTVGRIVGMDGKVHRIKLETSYKSIKSSLKILKSWCSNSPTDPPTLILNKHCPACQFQQMCRKQAEKDNNLSLLDRMTTKEIKKYNKRGIFTVQQLSYLFKPRRKRKKRKRPEPIKHNLALQALAIREGKTYIKELPELNRQPLELFLDIEGIPDQRFYYLIGLLVYDGKRYTQHSFWADNPQDEKSIWRQLVAKIDEYPGVPIYHYGNYDAKALSELSTRYSDEPDEFKTRLINVNKLIFGKIYFPTHSNSLKKIGLSLGYTWTSKNASGLKSLAWRYCWEEEQNEKIKESLIEYNQEDCHALQLVVRKMSEISLTSDMQDDIEFTDRLKKVTTETGETIHRQLESVLKFAHSNYDKNKLILARNNEDFSKSNPVKRGPKYGHPGQHRTLPRADKSIDVPMRVNCPKCGCLLGETEKTRKKTIIDLKIRKTGFQKQVVQYWGPKGYCEQCGKCYNPIFIDELGHQLFSHSFRAWLVYQRLFLRLPFNVIEDEVTELFNETISQGTLVNYVKNFSTYYSESVQILLDKILASPFIHADEMSINIQGLNQYVWTFTDGNHVIFKLTETRESDILHEIIHNYSGVLVSDFYGGYDAVPCKQQKCWVHLIRDINDDLWKSPFDTEYEAFVLKIKEFILPVFEAVDKYGLKKRNLRKFKKEVERFYKNNIIDRDYKSELATKYKNRFERYKDSLFTFLEYDSIPWHNNTAERALRHIAVQRKISGSFYESGAASYLVLLGIMQTCRFQEKSFLKFLVSGEKDVDAFKSPRKRKRKKFVASDTSKI